MANAFLYRGGTPVIQIPNCDGSSLFTTPPARRVAAEYDYGYFSLSTPVDTGLIKFQETELMQANPQVNEHIVLLEVPPEHTLSSVFFRIFGTDETMAGAAVTLAALEYDIATEQYTEVDIVTDAATAQGVTAIPLDAESNNFVSTLKVTDEYAVPHYVPSGKALYLTLKVASLPTDTNIRLADMRAKLRFVAKVDGFDAPIQM